MDILIPILTLGGLGIIFGVGLALALFGLGALLLYLFVRVQANEKRNLARAT